MKYKMAVLDIDGTLITSKRKLTTGTKEVIGKLKEKKIPVCLCTGRSLTGTLPVAKKLDLGTPFACIDGALIYDMYSGKALSNKVLDRQLSHRLLDLASSSNVCVSVTTHNRYYRYIKNNNLQKFDFMGTSFHFSRLIEFSYGVRNVRSLDKFYKLDQLYEIIVTGEPAEVEKVKEAALAIGNDTLWIRDDLWKNYMFFRPQGVQKSEGVKSLCSHFGVDMSEVVAIGDEFNDLDMLRTAGMGVAMGNANKEVKEAADYITLTNDQDGAAAALAKFFEI